MKKLMIMAVVAAGCACVGFAADAYLESTGTQVINTGYHVKPTTRIVADYAFTTVTPTQQRVFGAASDDASAALSCAHYINGGGQYAWAMCDGKGNWTASGIAATTDRRTLDLNGTAGTVKLLTGGTTSYSANMNTTRTNTGARPLAIFANTKNTAGNSFDNYGKLRLYSLYIYEGISLVRYYKPYQSADGTVTGLKDMLTGEILTNVSGNSAFSCGGDIGPTPSWDLDDGQVYFGTGTTETWNGLAWTTPIGENVAAPSTLTNACVTISNATVSVAAADEVGLMRLALVGGAKLDIAADAVAAVKLLYVDGAAIPRGIYTGTGTTGTQVSWLEGEGVLRVAGGEKLVIPSIFPTPAADGWYEFGLSNSGTSYAQATYQGSTHHYIIGAHPIWNDYAFPPGAKLRLVNNILLDTVPAGWFSQYDTSGLELVFVNGTQAFADGTKFTVPSGCIFRCQPRTWTLDNSVANKWWCTSAASSPLTYTDDLEINGTHTIHGDGLQTAQQIYSGHITGTGSLYINSFSKQCKYSGGYDATLKLSSTPQGGALWFDTTTITGKLTYATLHACKVTDVTGSNNGKFGTNYSYCAFGLLLGKNNSDATADHELKVDYLVGNANDTTDIPSGVRWRHGGEAFIWGNNTLHVGELTNGLHVVARRQDQLCNHQWMGNSVQKGIGNIVIDKFVSGNLYPSTNINVKIGSVVAASKIDYTYQSGAINRLTLDITNSCNASAIVKATDIGMLPARVSGFKGKVQLTDTATKSYTMPIDLTHGTNCLYNTVGCIGSGTLDSAPASGSINVTFPTTGDKPVKGEYALARFTSGGDKLSGWTVTLNGQAKESVVANGMEIRTVKDETGLWLKVARPGVTLVFR